MNQNYRVKGLKKSLYKYRRGFKLKLFPIQIRAILLLDM